MKTKILLTIVIAFSIFTTAFAQKGLNFVFSVQPDMKMIGGDFNVPTSSGSYIPMDKKMGIGFQAGGAIGYNFTDNLGLSLGLMYSAQGQNYDDYVLSESDYNGSNFYTATSTVTRKVSLNYLKLPFQFNFNTNPANTVAFAGFAGFYLGVLLSYTDETTINGTYNDGFGTETYHASAIAKEDQVTYLETSSFSASESNTSPLSEKPYKTADFGATIGAGIQLKLSDKISLPIMLNYQIGLADVKNNGSLVTHDSGDTDLYWNSFASYDDRNIAESYHNSTLGLLFGLKITL